MSADMGDFWVFGYGSLIWHPGFAHVETRRARLNGYRRALCVTSVVHRGTPERPGLVLGLDRGGACVGLAFRVPAGLRAEVLAYLRARELVTNVYLERSLPVRLSDGSTVAAVCYIVDRTHPQYAHGIDAPEAASIVEGAQGRSGANSDYVASTLTHLQALGIRDRRLEEIGRLLAGKETRADFP
jgi:cation transport protein ChaC